MQFDLADAVAVLERAPRTLRALLDGLPDRWLDAPLPAPDPQPRFAAAQSIPLAALLDDSERMRAHDLGELGAWQLDRRELQLSGKHPALGAVTLGRLLATWTVHDLAHVVQIRRTMARQYEHAVGPWCTYLSVMHR